ncbi:lysosomal acid phosphatase [Trichonephila inaurata madagascariensis]|uniref:Lysosomal acid phosphatase n=1 Tax=Trichonephila inaurata madagascariensis TaxID=2747483 RepID=A0A8X6X264_9ARAC|nr:lysosomal acid phosphatase [Trichonephila inaurata madagascariensis]
MLVQMLFRHGHRAPFMLYPYDPNSMLDWKEGMGMLTQLGRLQHYALGVHLQERYKDFITTNPREIEMINSNNYRCQYGVYSFIAGLYSPTKEYSFTDEIRWQPIISRQANFQGKVGPLLGFMIDKMNDKLLQREPEKKIYIYSAHGSNIACLLLALDQYNWKGPPYASTVVLELWKDDDEDYSIRWLYFNSTNPEKKVDPPVVLKIDGCGGDFCSYGRFQDIIRRLIPDDWKKECNDSSQKERFQPFESPVHVS